MLVVSDYPARVGWAIAMRCPSRINDAVAQSQACPLEVVRGVKNDVTVGAVGTSAGVRCKDLNRSAKLVHSHGETYGVQAVMIKSCCILAHCHDVDRPIRPAFAVYHWRGSDAYFRCDRVALIRIRWRLARLEE